MLKFIESLKDGSQNAEKDKLISFLTNLISILQNKTSSSGEPNKYTDLFLVVINAANKQLDPNNQILLNTANSSTSSSEIFDFEKINLSDEYKLIAMIITAMCINKTNKIESFWDLNAEEESILKNSLNIFEKDKTTEKDSPNLQYLHQLGQFVGKQETVVRALSLPDPIKALLSHPTSLHKNRH